MKNRLLALGFLLVVGTGLAACGAVYQDQVRFLPHGAFTRPGCSLVLVSGVPMDRCIVRVRVR